MSPANWVHYKTSARGGADQQVPVRPHGHVVGLRNEALRARPENQAVSSLVSRARRQGLHTGFAELARTPGLGQGPGPVGQSLGAEAPRPCGARSGPRGKWSRDTWPDQGRPGPVLHFPAALTSLAIARRGQVATPKWPAPPTPTPAPAALQP